MKRKNKGWLVAKIFLILILLLLCGFISPLKLTKYDLTFDNLPESFDGYRIVQITDFHCKDFGEKEENLIKMVKNANPDLILLTGDIVDEDHTIENAQYLFDGICELAPVYYVMGNHEYYDGAPYQEFKDLCSDYGVTILKNETVEIKKDDDKILLTGLEYVNYAYNMKEVIGYADANYFNILIYHDSSRFDFFKEYDYDLLLCGHLHGGLIRLPFVGGLLSSEYTFFPEYDYGMFQEKNSIMISSSGLGDARVPRWNNPRECVLIKLHCEKD